MRTRLLLGSAAALALGLGPAQAETVIEDEIGSQYETLRLVQVADGLENPWGLAFLPGGGMLVTERSGRLQRVDADGAMVELDGVPEVVARGQGGMLDVALHPDYDDNGWIYLTYSSGEADATSTTLARARLEGDGLVELEELFVQEPAVSPGRHYGSRIAFAADGTILFSIGDRGDPDRAQDLTDHAGSIIRLNDDGSVPDDNPFTGRSEARPEIFSYGHRNPQGLIVHPVTGYIWSHEHGPRGGDELNRIEKGKNYGWPVISHGLDYRTQEQVGMGREKAGMEAPLRDWTPAIAPSGLAHYQGDAFGEQWQDNLFVGSLVRTHLRRVVMAGDTMIHEEELLRDVIGRIRDVREGPDGNLYLLNDDPQGGVFRLEPAG